MVYPGVEGVQDVSDRAWAMLETTAAWVGVIVLVAVFFKGCNGTL